MTKIRTGQAPAPLTRTQFQERFNVRFYDPAFEGERDAIARLEAIAWEAMQEGRKAPITKAAGRGFADATCQVSVQWLDTRRRLKAAQKRWSDTTAPSRVLLVCGSARNDGTCPGEVSKTGVVERSGIDRMVCADGGNPDPTTTHGKRVVEAKAIEQQGWDYPKHVAGRAYGVVVHGDVAGVEAHRRNLCDWLEWMGLIDAGAAARLDRYTGYYEPYYNSHDALDKDKDVQEEVRNVARSVVQAVKELRAGRLSQPDKQVRWPRTK